jgi:Putative auto-transporter adhesin, head GIN domain
MNQFLPLHLQNNAAQKFNYTKGPVIKLTSFVIIMICLMFAPAFLSAQSTSNQNDLETSKIILPSFTKIKAGTNVRVILVQSTTDSVFIYTSKETAKHIRYSISNGELSIRGNYSFLSDKTATVLIGVTNLQKIVIDENATVSTNGILKTNTLAVLMRGDGTASINADAENVTTNIKGKGKVTITGNYETSSSYFDVYGAMVIEYARKEVNTVAQH